VITALALVAAVPTGAHASASSDFVAKINAARQSHGGQALTVRGDLAAAAQAQAERMADRSDLFHNPDLGGSVSHWSALAENVGYGPDVATIHTAFMNSPGHRTNILNAKYTEVGVGVVVRDHVVWVAEVFRRPTGQTSSSGSGSGSSAAPTKKPSSTPKSSTRATTAPTKAAKSTAAKKAAPTRATPVKAPVRSSKAVVRAALVVPAQATRPALAGSPWLGTTGGIEATTTTSRPAPRPGSPGIPPAAGLTLGLLALVVIGGAARLRVLG
jgi:hypothetical protein